jgi:hypothetical protein
VEGERGGEELGIGSRLQQLVGVMFEEDATRFE